MKASPGAESAPAPADRLRLAPAQTIRWRVNENQAIVAAATDGTATHRVLGPLLAP